MWIVVGMIFTMMHGVVMTVEVVRTELSVIVMKSVGVEVLINILVIIHVLVRVI